MTAGISPDDIDGIECVARLNGNGASQNLVMNCSCGYWCRCAFIPGAGKSFNANS
jgi:hypothetical protein